MPVTPCVPVTPTFGIVEFSAPEFLASYPEFTGINQAMPTALENDFTGATMLLNNSCCSRVQDANQRLFLLYLLTAHTAAIAQGTNDGNGNMTPPLGVVGRISDASEGDVSVSAQWEAPPNPSAAYFLQTKYGAQFWQMTAKYRRAIFLPAPPGAYAPLGSYGIGPWGPGGGYGQ